MKTMSSEGSPRLPSALMIPLQETQLKDIVEKSKDFALMHGIAMRSKTNFSSDSLQFAPFVLIPSVFPRKEFEKAVKIQTILNELMHKVAYNANFLRNTLKDVIAVDDFTGNLYRIHEVVLKEGMTQKLSLGLLRSDYMVNSTSGIKQVEINSIASSFGGVTSKVSAFHRYILQELGHEDKITNLPENNALQGLCKGIIEAWKIYGNEMAYILFVVENVTYNICDQRFHEYEIRKLNPKIRIIRRTLTEIANTSKLGHKNELIIDHQMEIGLIYFRAGYDPSHYPTKKEWEVRLLMERSLAIKCPSIQYHLAGTKKIQQTLAKPGCLELFFDELEKIEAIREIFTGLYGLEFDDFGERAIKLGINNPERFVLKPQREGGGNNTYGLEVKEVLLKLKDSPERIGWILMERILPPLSTGYIIRPDTTESITLIDLISELGIFGVIIGDSENVYLNKQVGHMLRTKASTTNEGGVASGSGALDSPYLIE